MMPKNSELDSHWPRAEDDPRLEAIIEQAVDDLAVGATVDVETLVAAHPELAARLRELLPTVLKIADLGAALEDAGGLVEALGGQGGDRELGDFRLIRELGRGGMGVVYEAEQLSIGRRVALKVLPFAAMLERQQLNRFKNEARAAGTLDHPNIVAVYSVGCERGVHYYAMQLIEGHSLAQVIDQLRAGSTEQGAESKVSGVGCQVSENDASAVPGSPDPAHPTSSIQHPASIPSR